MNTLDELLGAQEPHATFHDAEVTQLTYDPATQDATITANVCVGNPDASSSAERQRRRQGVLRLRGVTHWRQERNDQAPPRTGIWLADDGPLAEAPSGLAREMARELRANEIGWYFFFADSNSFIYWIAADAKFHWLGAGEPAA